MSYNADKKTVTLRLIAADGSTNGGMNFNGGARGNQTITIPAGWSVKAHVVNKDAIPHSAIIVADAQPFPAIPQDPALPRAYTSHLTDGLAPMDGTDDLSFKTSKPGSYVVLCGVPGHGQSGMYIKFNVSADAAVPAYKM
jgi:sulfocyanin